MIQDRVERLRRDAELRAIEISRDNKRKKLEQQKALSEKRSDAIDRWMAIIWMRLVEAAKDGNTRIVAPRLDSDNLLQRTLLVERCVAEGLYARIIDDPNYSPPHLGHDMAVEVSTAPFEY